jgi:hypothetical protein
MGIRVDLRFRDTATRHAYDTRSPSRAFLGRNMHDVIALYRLCHPAFAEGRVISTLFANSKAESVQEFNELLFLRTYESAFIIQSVRVCRIKRALFF